MGFLRSILIFYSFFLFLTLSSYRCPNPEVEALISIKRKINDPQGCLHDWDEDSVDPCTWAMITCSSDNLVTVLGAPGHGLSGTLSAMIANLTNLKQVLLENNNFKGQIPPSLGHISNLTTLDLANNSFTGLVPDSLSHLDGLQYLRLSNNNLSGPIPLSLANLSHLTYLDLSYNNLSGPVPKFSAKTFNIMGNHLICGSHHNQTVDCYESSMPDPLFLPLNSSPGHSNSERLAIASNVTLGCLTLFILACLPLLPPQQTKLFMQLII